ncbi:hypothetical protein [Nonomuraea sediminis]|uniref:hypothetical protein n=1 Tax=Nonomuraea sediminis TaxID=2835864 RepID=UPI001BDC9146|nr:hypothetical protein [Nonomuraea sediminis]
MASPPPTGPASSTPWRAPEEIRKDKGHFLVYDHTFARRSDDDQPWLHAWNEANLRWPYEGPRSRTGTHWASLEASRERTPADAQTSSIAGLRFFKSADFPLIS